MIVYKYNCIDKLFTNGCRKLFHYAPVGLVLVVGNEGFDVVPSTGRVSSLRESETPVALPALLFGFPARSIGEKMMKMRVNSRGTRS